MPGDRLDARAFRLVADVGGTNSRIGLCRDDALLGDTVRRYPNAGFRDFGDVIAAYRAEMPARDCGSAVISVAGPVEAGRASMTNLGWQFDEAGLSGQTGIAHVHLVNDLQAQGYAIEGLSPSDVRRIVDGAGAPVKWPVLVVGIGTGLNTTVVHDTPCGLFATASESGHVRLCSNRPELAALADATGFVSVEDAVSGRGLSRLHAALHGLPEATSPAGKEIVAAALDSDSRAAGTMRVFLELLGNYVGDLALIHLPFGGIYISGGVGRAILPLIDASGFEAAFCDKGRFQNLMRRFPVGVLLDDDAALKGAGRASLGFGQMEPARSGPSPLSGVATALR